MLASAPGTANTPRAHITNMAALECLRDIGLEEECQKVAVKGESMQHTRWCKSMAGEEFARIYSWGNDPQRAVSITIFSRRQSLTLSRVNTMQRVHANMSISPKLSSNLCSFSMLPRTTSLAASIPFFITANTSLVGR
jgi:hypothetical protein